MSAKRETVIAEYQSEAEARGHVQRRATFKGCSSSPRVMKLAADQADRWGLPYSVLEVIEITDRNGPDECHDSRGNLDECLGLCEVRLVSQWEKGLGLRPGSIRPA
jgi:hypothetical protein